MHYSWHHLPSSLSHLTYHQPADYDLSFSQLSFCTKTNCFASKALLQNLSPKVPRLRILWLEIRLSSPTVNDSLSCATCAMPHHDMSCHEVLCRDMSWYVMSCHAMCPLMMSCTARFQPLNRPLQLGWNGCDTETLVKVIFMQGITWQNKSAVWVQNLFYFIKNIQTTLGSRQRKGISIKEDLKVF